MEGAIMLHRSLLDSYAFSNETTLKIWIWLLLKANWKKGFVEMPTGEASTTVEVCRGEFVFGRNKAEKELEIPASTVERHLKKLEAKSQIVRKVNRHFTLITICKYDSYQLGKNKSEQALNNHRTSTEQPLNTNNKDNKDNKEEEGQYQHKIFEIMRRQLFPSKFSDSLLKSEARKLSEKYPNQIVSSMGSLISKWVSNLKPDLEEKKMVL